MVSRDSSHSAQARRNPSDSGGAEGALGETILPPLMVMPRPSCVTPERLRHPKAARLGLAPSDRREREGEVENRELIEMLFRNESYEQSNKRSAEQEGDFARTTPLKDALW